MNLPIIQLDLPDLLERIPENEAARLKLVALAQPDNQHERRGRHVHGLRSFCPDRPFVSFAWRQALDRVAVPIPDVLRLAVSAHFANEPFEIVIVEKDRIGLVNRSWPRVAGKCHDPLFITERIPHHYPSCFHRGFFSYSLLDLPPCLWRDVQCCHETRSLLEFTASIRSISYVRRRQKVPLRKSWQLSKKRL